MVATGHLFEKMMANYDSLGNAGKVAGNSSNTQWRVHCVCRFPVVTLTLACYRLGQSQGFRRSCRGPPHVLQVLFRSSVEQS